ncbi:MAG: undecaprenyldiphospho-muramoylpentapeptide beta-N-acetylglucosaminyltransferase [Verrucomicrobiales bacterium]
MDHTPAQPLHILIACGGTGGHLFPGIAVAQELKSQGHRVTLLISEKKVDAQASQKYAELDFVTIPAIAKPPTFSPRMLPFLWKLWRTISACKKLIRERGIDRVLGMGGFTSFPPAFAAKQLGIPAFIHDSNAIPGRSNQLTAKHCQEILLGFQHAATYFPGRKTSITGTPVRDELRERPSQREAREKLGLDPARDTLLVMGGSQGAQKLNSIVLEGSANSPWQIIHLTGQADFDRVSQEAAQRPHHHVLAFCEDMAAASAAADFAIIRSGASSLTELAHVGLPSLLVPFPYAVDDHQTANARVFEQAGAALLIQEADLSATQLQKILHDLLQAAPRHKMAAAASSLATPQAATEIARAVTRRAENHS